MIESKRTTICERCRSSVPVSSLRYVPRGIDSEVALCPDCVEKTKQHSPEKRDRDRDRTKSAGKAQFLCKRCNFKFSKPETVDEAGIACPFCGKKDRIESYGVNYAENLVKDPGY
ncbi:MAG TPA: hypothetical protein VJH95_01485 [Candidatus Nanoarchaeia archaeon]|nr:hypothetical protein [Candidatus Nanoarchaeia archaeon]